MLSDSHAHLSGEALYPQAEALLQRAQAAGVRQILNVCTDPRSLQRGLQLARCHPQVANIAAITPHDAANAGDAFFQQVAAAAASGALVGIGETGLDYHHAPADVQQAVLIRHLQLARQYGLPVAIHCRQAFADFFALIDRHYGARPLLLHCFTGTLAEAKEALDRGYLLSFSGILTFKNSQALRQIAQQVPAEQLLIETDAPYLAPYPHRGQLCEPAFVRQTAECLAKIRDVSLSEIAAVTTGNWERVFRCNKASAERLVSVSY